MPDVRAALTAVFTDVRATGRLHVVDLEDGREVGLDPDRPVVLASVAKVLIALEFARQVAEGQLDPADRLRVQQYDRLGGTGTAGCLDDVEMSLRDLALSMMAVSDNTAADLLLARIGLDNVRSLVAELDLPMTTITGSPRTILGTIAEDMGVADMDELAAALRTATPAEIRATRAHDPAHTSATTPRDMTRLLGGIWRDDAADEASCAHVRWLMGQQVNWHRIAGGMPEGVLVAAKSGTLPCLRNEVGVATYPDGRRYAIAIFTVIDTVNQRRPEVDGAIGRAARLAVDYLRSDRE